MGIAQKHRSRAESILKDIERPSGKMTTGSDRAFKYPAKRGNAVHSIARNEAVRDWLRVSAAMAKPTIDPPNEPIDLLVKRSRESHGA